jgi:hypothetical protein
MVHRPHHVDQNLAEQAMQIFKEWLEVRRVAWLEWRATVARLSHFDLNDSDEDDEAPMGGMHSTSRGVHNLAMTGDMPIAQYSMDELLTLLDNALDSDATATDADRLAVSIAQRAGARTIRPSALAAIKAACRFLRKPHAHASPARAAIAHGCNVRTCEEWVDRIQECLLAEASSATAAAAATTGASASGSSTDQANAAPAACSPEEVAAIDSLVSLSDEQHHTGPPGDGPPPTLPPSPPSTTAPPGTATPRTPKRTRGAYVASILTKRGGATREGAARPATPSATETAILQMALQSLSDEDLEQLCNGPGGDEEESQPVGSLSLEERRVFPWADTPRGRNVPERRLQHGASSTAPASLGGIHRWNAP